MKSFQILNWKTFNSASHLINTSELPMEMLVMSFLSFYCRTAKEN
jgi:hypothetical protein